ncbi:P-loop containing nucleoside triphosphate hydrolase protein [Pleomassaria siparia CBS 279.74]|uniref:P-loop containing nucleoside triphosphate hydrolase protein n=1 Tax=Pleomassaria siparia CBS 279.74 TaxID=1314801 RepID=A0A6G1KLW8_9PLEO|nr:P-loop containing nucleoside triphosphate hydrolase protein [Pleomassaria siparia CBS 279.74]
MEDQEDARVVQLTKLFNATIHGQRDMKREADGNRFLEAVCAQKDVSKCVENIIAAKGGTGAVAKAFRFSTTSAFLNGPATSFLHHLSDPSLKQLYSGQFLYRILEQIVQPPTFWNTFVEAHDARILTEHATHAFAWLLLEVLCCRSEDVPDVRDLAERITKSETFINSASLDIRNIGHKIKHVLDSTSSDPSEDGPGGRHDNDFVDFRRVKNIPTSDEFVSTDMPFYRRADAIDLIEPEKRGLIHLDNQYRLLREEMVGELRSDFQVASGQKKGRRRTVLTNLMLDGFDCGIVKRRKTCSFKFRCSKDIPQMANIKGLNLRKKFLSGNRTVIKHGSFGCLISNGNVVAFATIDRNEDLLALEPAVVVLQVANDASFEGVLIASKLSSDLQFVQVDTAVFAYEPFLKCLQTMTELPMQDQLLNLRPESSEVSSGIAPQDIINRILENRGTDLQSILGTPNKIELDAAQSDSLLAGLMKRVSLIQGPPGTGKSFIGALIAKILHDHTNEKILVQTFTNHALDQFLEDLQGIGIPSESIVRLGGKFNTNTKHMSMREQKNNYKMSQDTYRMIQIQKSQSEAYHDNLMKRMAQFQSSRFDDNALIRHLELSEDSEFYDAFQLPVGDDDMIRVGTRGKKINPFYLIRQWSTGKQAGFFHESAQRDFPAVWSMDHESRITLRNRWIQDVIKEHASDISNLARKYNDCQEQLGRLFAQKDAHIMRHKRIIGCTTTGAANYQEQIQKISPGIVLVEEAGEILEAHVLTAMTPKTKQLVLIGDHKQLRPKVNKWSLTIEEGSGFNLNMSLFERLVLSGVPHTALNSQHRMRPEISSLVRNLTYPELEDAPKTQGRPNIRGLQNNVIFVSHKVHEEGAERIADRHDQDSKSSKENKYEAEMVLKFVRYLGQQGYNTDDVVILTPYLGQLVLLRDTLARDNDPILNDLDSSELIRAGLLSPAAADISKRKIRLSTIDNYQGEEAPIIVASMTRSNTVGDIGFMSAPQRVNVLLSRARNGLIMIGNADTFMNSRKGKEVWVPLMDQLRRDGHVYEGLPIKCEQHPDKEALLNAKEQFDTVCPDGGCSEPCGKMLSCDTHTCPQRCHQLQDHSKMECKAIVTSTCPQKHQVSRKCHDKAAAAVCHKCEAEARRLEKRRQRDHKLDQERQTKQKAYAARLAEVEDEIEHQKRLLKDQNEEQDRRDALSQKKVDLSKIKAKASKTLKALDSEHNKASADKEHDKEHQLTGHTAPTLTSTSSSQTAEKTEKVQNDSSTFKNDREVVQNWDASESKEDWEWQKRVEGAENKALDSLMKMIGLESVKQQFLAIKAKVDTLVRQGVSLTSERFGSTLLGNPGTGKTTVARLYAKFLVEVGALPGDYFHETSGSSLANDGVSACKAQIDKILEEGGGVFFIDEAYQLVSGNSYGGKAVLDFLLAEIENLTGKIVFVLAGYNKQMESFFAHNPGIPSRIPMEMEFQDYNDQELQRILCYSIDTKYKGNMKVEGGMAGLYIRILSRRIGRRRGRDGFGNAREVQNGLSQVIERQAKRLRKERRAGLQPDDNFFAKEDLIGPEPSATLNTNVAWAKLQKLIGLTMVKESVQVLLDGIKYNYQRELEEKPLIQYSLNRCFIGSPGTGKTSVAKLYGRMLADIGLLSNGEVVVKNPADFVGSALGQSEQNTKGILASTVGKVLIIDEAYMLAGNAVADPFKTAVIDTIVAEVQSTPGEDRCVLLLGYKDQMEEMFRDVNPGLARRFPLDSAFVFEDFTDPELRQILDLKLKGIGFNATDQAKAVCMDMLGRARNRSNFGNAGEVDILLDKAKAAHQKNVSAGNSKQRDTFEAVDFDPDFDRGERAATNLPQLFQDVVGCEELIAQFQGYMTTASNMKALGMDPREQIPFNFLFKGPPGTGKTTTAQKMGKVYYDMGFLAQAKVIECSATDLIGQYIGHTGPKVQKLLEKALGKVLFIDEAYRLAEGHFATEAMDELVDCLTKPKFALKLVVILAGYDQDMDRLISVNPGLSSRFPDSVVFSHLEPETCLELLIKVLRDLKLKKKAPLDLDVLTPPSIDLHHEITDLFQRLSGLQSWGNARDVKSLAKAMFQALISKAKPPVTDLYLTEDIIIGAMEAMFNERSHRTAAAGTTRHASRHSSQTPPEQQQNAPNARAPKMNTRSSTPPHTMEGEQKKPSSNSIANDPASMPARGVKRDAGVSDEVWQQLEIDKKAAHDREKRYQRLQEEKKAEEKRIEELKRAEQAAKDDEEKRKWEVERIIAETERRKKEEERAALERARELEMKTKKKLMELGVCPAGYQWTKEGSGYRCAGGSHFLSNAQLGL